MMTVTTKDINNLVKGYRGTLLRLTANGEYDIEFPDAVHAMSFKQTVDSLNTDEHNLGFWVNCLCVRLRDGDSISDLNAPVVLTVW